MISSRKPLLLAAFLVAQLFSAWAYCSFAEVKLSPKKLLYKPCILIWGQKGKLSLPVFEPRFLRQPNCRPLTNLLLIDIMLTIKKTRTRLSPEARISEILDHTANLVSSDGVAAVNMEKISKAAGVSKSLIYSYFASTTELLKALLQRELQDLRHKQTRATLRAGSFAQLVRGVTHAYLSHIEERGLLLYRLQSEPSVSEGGGPTSYGRETAVQYLAEIAHRTFNIPMSIAVPATDISFGLPDAAGNYLDKNKANRKLIEDITVTMIIACIKSIKDEYEVSFKPLR